MRLTLIFLFFTISVSAQKIYQKNYFDSGVLKSEGWIENHKKTQYWTYYYANGKVEKQGHYVNGYQSEYWHFYRKNGTKSSEGHFINGKKSSWWLYYDASENVNHKCQLKDNQKNGYCFMFKNKKVTFARKYKTGKKIKEWKDFKSFRKENSLRDLQ